VINAGRLTTAAVGGIIRSDMTPPAPRFGWPTRLGAGAMVALGLLLVLGATGGPAPGPGLEPGARVAVRVPDPVKAVVVGLIALSAVLLLALQRRRRAGDEPALPERAAARRSPWVAAVAALMPLVTVLVIWYLVWRYWSGPEGQPIEQAFAAIAGLLDLLTFADKPATSIPALDVAVAALLVLLAVGAFALMVLVAMAERIERWLAGTDDEDPGAPAAPEPAAEPEGDLRAEPDPRRAVVAAYRRFERAAAAARAPRARWQTPAEFMRSVLGRLPLPAAPVQRLTALFEVARFSPHPVGAEARDAACACLDEITTALAARDPRER
jgi:Domain of unknown function (DUF4129)